MQMDSTKQQVECPHHSGVQIDAMNTARLQILSCKRPESCNLCAEGALIKQGGAGTKESGAKEEEEVKEEVVVVEDAEMTKMQQKKKNKKKKDARKKKQQQQGDRLWVCLECSLYFCDGAGSVPHGHIRDHWKQYGHCWVANYKNPTMVYCFKCKHDVSIRIPDVLCTPKKTTPLEPTQSDWNWGSDLKDSVEPEPLLDTRSGWSWNSSWSSDSKDNTDDKTSTKESVDEDQVSTPVQVPSPLSDVDVERNQSLPVSKDDIVIPGSTEKLTETDIPITDSSASLTAKDTAITVPAANQTVRHCNFIRGLENTGNTCFLNVILQSLLALDSLRCKFIGTDVGTGPLAVSLKQLFIETSSSNNRNVLNPKSLATTVRTKWPQFKKGSMEDAEELLAHLLAGLKEEEAIARNLLGDASNAPLIFDSIFLGQECSTQSSKGGCTHNSISYEDTLIFRLPIPPGRLPPVRANDDDVHDSYTRISLKDCFSLYTEEEEISWCCQKCTDAANAKMSETKPVVEAGGLKQDKEMVYRTAGKRILITKAPEVLVVTFRRYSQYEKIEGHVQFEEFLDIQPYMHERSKCNETETKYRLVSVAEHSGNPTGGHYIAYLRASKMTGLKHDSNDSKTWFRASDEYIKEVSLPKVLSCEAYMLFYERCPADAFQSSATVTGEKSQNTDTDLWPQRGDPFSELQSSATVTGEKSRHTDTDLWPQRGDPFSEPIPPPEDWEPWEQQRSKNRDKRREQNITMKDAMLLPKFWVFLDRFTLSGDGLPYYRFLLVAMVMGSRLGQLSFSYPHLVSHSKELAMDICNGYARLRVTLVETARKYIQELAKRYGVTESARMQQLELDFLGMPKTHEELKQCLSTNLLTKMNVFGHSLDPVMVPLSDKCALVQSLIEHVVSRHRSGYSWEGEFEIDDMDVFDREVVINKSPNLFEIEPMSREMIEAMEKDFNSIVKVVKRFSCPNVYVPYLKPFITLLSGMRSYAHWWLKPTTAELLRQWIQHFLFLKPPMARSNFIVDIFTASRSYDAGDTAERFKVILETMFVDPWIQQVNKTTNTMLHQVLHHKDPTKNTSYYQEELNFLFELLRHLTVHGTERTFDKMPPPAPRKQLVRLLDELEIAGAFELENAVFQALTTLLKESEMHGMLRTIWECYIFCNYPYRK